MDQSHVCLYKFGHRNREAEVGPGETGQPFLSLAPQSGECLHQICMLFLAIRKLGETTSSNVGVACS